MYLLLYCKGSKKGYTRLACERELETEQNCYILTPTLMAVSVVSFSFSRAAQPEAQRPSFLLSTGLLYHILSSNTSNLQLIRAPRVPPPGFLYHILSATGSRNYWGPRAPLRPGVAFPPTSRL